MSTAAEALPVLNKALSKHICNCRTLRVEIARWKFKGKFEQAARAEKILAESIAIVTAMGYDSHGRRPLKPQTLAERQERFSRLRPEVSAAIPDKILKQRISRGWPDAKCKIALLRGEMA